jgi:hypothetical protein
MAMRCLSVLWVCLAVVAAAAGCGLGVNPTVIPSKACGGYHIVIENAAQSEISIRINDEAVTTAAPGQTIDIAQIGNYAVEPMPWDVEVRRVADGTVLFSAHLVNDGSDGRQVRVTDSPGDQVTLRDYIC